MFEEAAARFDSLERLSTEPALDAVILAVSTLDDVLKPDDRRLLAEAVAMRSRLRYTLGRLEAAASDALWLLQVGPDPELDETAVSPLFLELLSATRTELTGAVRLPPGDIRAWLDDRRVDGGGDVPVRPGLHRIRLENPEGRRIERQVRVSAHRTVSAMPPPRRVPLPTASDFRPTPDETPRRPDTPSLPRRLVVRLDAAFDAYGVPFADAASSLVDFQSTTFSTLLESRYFFEPPPSVRGRHLGATVRLSRRLALGVTLHETASSFRAEVDATLSAPGQSLHDAVAVLGLTRRQRFVHFEFTATAGGPDWEASAFAGPSLTTVTQETIDGVHELDGRHRPPRIAVFLTRELRIDQKLGVHAGLDATWFFTPHLGIGGGLRYTATASQALTEGIIAGAHAAMGIRLRL